MLAWALWLGAGGAAATGAARAATPAARERGDRDAGARRGCSAVALASLCGLGGTVAVGEAVAATERPDSHHLQYQPVRAIAAGIERLLPPGQTVNLDDRQPRPRHPADGAGDPLPARAPRRSRARQRLVPAAGLLLRALPPPGAWIVLLTDGSRPQRHMTLAARVSFVDGWGHEMLSAWVRQVGTGTAGAG